MASLKDKQAKESQSQPQVAKSATVARIVVGPKKIWFNDPETNESRVAEIGEEIYVTERAAKAFAAYLENPKVAAAKAAVVTAEAGESEDE